MIEHFDVVVSVVTVVFALVGSWFTMKMNNEQNSKEIESIKNEINIDLKDYKKTSEVLFKRVDEQREQIYKIKIQNSNFVTKEHILNKHYTKDEMNQLLKNIENNHKEGKVLLNKIYDNLLNMSKLNS